MNFIQKMRNIFGPEIFGWNGAGHRRRNKKPKDYLKKKKVRAKMQKASRRINRHKK